MADLKALAQEMIDGFQAGDIDAAIDRYMAEDFVEHETAPGMDDHTREAPRQMFKMMNSAFPDLQIDIRDLVQEGDKVVARSVFSGTHEGEFMGMPATGNRFEIDVIDILEFRDRKCVAHWGVMDSAAMAEQLGAGAPH